MILTVITSLLVPLPASAEEAVAENSEIYAILYYINPNLMSGNSINNTQNIELVFQKGNTVDASRTVVRDNKGNQGIFSIANDATTYADGSIAPRTPWYSFSATSSNQNIARVNFKDRIKPESIEGWFRNCRYLAYDKILHKENLDTSVCTSMKYTFANCNQFTTFDFSQWPNLDFSNIIVMNYMFSECTGLHSIDLSGIDPVNCSDCSYMFYKNTALMNVKFGSFKAGNNVIKDNKKSGASLAKMFAECRNLEEVDLSEIDMDFPTSTASIFENCSSLTKADFSRLYGNTPLDGFFTNMNKMFKGRGADKSRLQL